MFIHRGFDFPRLEQLNQPTGRVYKVLSTGACYPSITRILDARPKPQLDAWKARVGRKEAARISNESITWGKSLHTLCEDYLDNKAIATLITESDETINTYWKFLRPWMDAHITEVHAQEQDVYSAHLKVAGRLDLLATLDASTLAVIDFKNSRKPKRESYIENYYIQGTFYSLCVYELTGQKVKRIVFPIVSTQGLQIFETTPGKHYAALRERIDEYYTHYAPSVL